MGTGTGTDPKRYLLSPTIEQDEIKNQLAACLVKHAAAPEVAVFVVHDTPDWDLFRAGQCIIEKVPGGRHYRYRISDGALVAETTGSAALPDRAGYAARFEIIVTREWFRLLGASLPELRMETLEVRRPGARSRRLLERAIVLGHDRGRSGGTVPGLDPAQIVKAREALERENGEAPAGQPTVPPKQSHRAFHPQAGHRHVRRQPTAQAALRRICSDLLEVMEAKENGIIAGGDIEALHDFRVAMRRMRSHLTAFDGVFPCAVSQFACAELSWLGKQTGKLRDYDVLLADYKTLVAPLAKRERKVLAPFRTALRSAREHHRARAEQALKSDRYFYFKQFWRYVLENSFEESVGINANRPAGTVAAAVVYNGYSALLAAGAVAEKEKSGPAFHEMRKQGKALRYSIDSFADDFPRATVREVTVLLKKLQTDLGAVQDSEVQSAIIEKLAKRLEKTPEASPRLHAALKALRRAIRKRGKKARLAAVERFRKLATPHIERKLGKLCDLEMTA